MTWEMLLADEESPLPVVDRLVAGAFRGDAVYAAWRSRGTTDWLLVHTLDGSGRFGSVDQTVLSVAAGDLVLLRPGTPHDYGTAPGTSGWDLQFVHFHPRTDWAPLLDWPEPLPGIRRLHVTGEARRRVTDDLDRTVVLSRTGLGRAQWFGLNALESALLWASTQRPVGGRLDPRLVTVLEMVSARLAEPLSTATLAREAGLSPSRLAHLFAEQLSTSPMRFVEQQRMRTAQQLLELSAVPVAAVARAVGYPDPLYFSVRFRRFAGLSPTGYRNRAQEPGG